MAALEEAYVVEIDAAALVDFEAAALAEGTFYLYECGDCGKRFTPEEYSKHTHDDENKNDPNAIPPDMIIMKPSKTVALKDLTEESKPFQCNLCGKPFMQASNLKRHMRTHTGEKPFKCAVCSRQFTQGNNLKAHLRIHSGERPFSCSYCDQKFTQGSNLRKHERSHVQPGYRPEKRFGCAQCGSWFVDYSILKAHIRVHTKERPYACTLCDARFSQESNLRRHHRTHTGEKPFRCTECDKQFSQGNNLKAHMIVHTGEKPLTCPACGARFSRASKYQQHYREVHLAALDNESGGSSSQKMVQYVDESGNVVTLDEAEVDEAGTVIKIIKPDGSTENLTREEEGQEQVVEILYQDQAEGGAGEEPSSDLGGEGMEGIKQEVDSEDDETEDEEEEESSGQVSMGNEGCDSFTVGCEEVSVAAVCEVAGEQQPGASAGSPEGCQRTRKRTANKIIYDD